MRAVGAVTAQVMLVAGIIWLIVYLIRRSMGRSSASQTRLARAVQVCSTDPRYRLGQVTAIAQIHPQRGTSAWVTWYGTPQAQPAWFANGYPPTGAWVVVTGAPAPDGRTFHVTAVHDVIT